MRKAEEAYWIKDGFNAELYVGKVCRAEAHTLLNHSAIYTPRGLFGKEERALIVGLEKCIVAEIEKTLGYGPLPIFDTRGNPLPEARKEMEESARSFDKDRPSDHPVRETIECLDAAHEALNEAARKGRLNVAGADARALCAKVSTTLGKHGFFSPETANTIRAACKLIDEAIGPEPHLMGVHMTAAGIHCDRAHALTRQYGANRQYATSQELQKQIASASEREGASVMQNKVTLTQGDPETAVWLRGHCVRWPDYKFKAKVMDAGSPKGINHGRVTALSVSHEGQVVMKYDRGWILKPASWRERAVLSEVLAGFPEGHKERLSTKWREGTRSGRGF
jgi:hypothetical protein